MGKLLASRVVASCESSPLEVTSCSTAPAGPARASPLHAADASRPARCFAASSGGDRSIEDEEVEAACSFLASCSCSPRRPTGIVSERDLAGDRTMSARRAISGCRRSPLAQSGNGNLIPGPAIRREPRRSSSSTSDGSRRSCGDDCTRDQAAAEPSRRRIPMCFTVERTGRIGTIDQLAEGAGSRSVRS